MKLVINEFAQIIDSGKFRYFGGVNVGSDVTTETLRNKYSAVIYATGAQDDTSLGIPGEEHILPAKDVVYWYNGYPDAPPIDLDGVRKVAIIGNGNVALDIARVLLSPVELLAVTDISTAATEALKKHRVQEVEVVARRGPINAAFSTKELRQTSKVPINIDMGNWMEVGDINVLDVPKQHQRRLKRSIQLMSDLDDLYKTTNPSGSVLRFRWLRSPVKLERNELTLEKTRMSNSSTDSRAESTGEFETLQYDKIIKSVGFKTQEIPGLPATSIGADNVCSRISQNEYLTGWLWAGAKGTIEQTLRETVSTMGILKEDIDGKRLAEVPEFELNIPHTTWSDWQKVDTYELEQGQARKKLREKCSTLKQINNIITG